MKTILDHFGQLEGLKVAWVGDGNNVLHSLMAGARLFGMNMTVATPKGFEPDAKVITGWQCRLLTGRRFPSLGCASQVVSACRDAAIEYTSDPREAVQGAHVVVTDTWVSMGQEEEKLARLKAFEGYQV